MALVINTQATFTLTARGVQQTVMIARPGRRIMSIQALEPGVYWVEFDGPAVAGSSSRVNAHPDGEQRGNLLSGALGVAGSGQGTDFFEGFISVLFEGPDEPTRLLHILEMS